MKRAVALTEAISHLNQGLELVSILPRSPNRTPANWGCAVPPRHCVAGPQRLADPGSLDQPTSGRLPWRSHLSVTTCLRQFSRDRTQRYDSLLKSRRQELHGKIARVIETRFPKVKDTEPEVLAHHLTEGGVPEAAIPLWQVAGELASKRMALTEAISHFNQGLELVSSLPRSSQRDTSELGLRTRLGTAWLGLKGWSTPELWTSLHPALALAKSLGRNDALVLILSGLTANVQTQGRVAESLQWAEEILDIAKATGDADLLVRDMPLPATATAGRASSPRLSGTPIGCRTSTTTRSIATLQTSSTMIPKLKLVFSARLAPGCWATRIGRGG